MKKLLSLSILCLWASANAQERSFQSVWQLLAGEDINVAEGGKCGTPLVFEASQRLKDLPATAQFSIRQVLQRPLTDTSRLSPSGRFRIHYDTSGVHEPHMLGGIPINMIPNSREEYVDSLGSILDHCWDVEVTQMGFLPPPGDGGVGGGNEYDVYIRSMASQDFGATSWLGEQQLESGSRDRFVTFMEIENDFFAQRTQGLAGLRVTAAHEFHHAIQIGSYGIWNTVPNSDFYFYELTSVWFEEVVYTDVNDYYFDLPIFFGSFKELSVRSLPFTEYSNGFWGYERSVWDLYLEKRFGRDVVRQIWEEMKADPLLVSMDNVLGRHGSSLRTAFAEFSSWNIFTGPRADTVRFYPESKNFPVIQPNVSSFHGGSATTVQGDAYPLSIQYARFLLVGGDTIIASLSNVDVNSAYSSPASLASYRLTLSGSAPTGAVQHLSNGLAMGFEAQQTDRWRTLYVSTGSGTDLKTRTGPSPNPLNMQTADNLLLPAEGSAPGEAQVFILTSSFDLEFSAVSAVVDLLGKKMVVLPTRDFSGKVSTGVHFVFMKTPQREYRWKVAFIK